jgi:hypothetical protein
MERKEITVSVENTLKNKKENLIDVINAKIDKIDIFYIGENEFDSPIYKKHNKDAEALIEVIYHNSVGIVEYVHGIEINSYKVLFEELSILQLKILLEMLK